MKASILSKLELLSARHEEIAGLLSELEIINDQNRFRALSMEYAQLEDVVKAFTEYQSVEQDKIAADEMLREDDAEMREMAEEEIREAKQRMDELELELQKLLLPKDPNDNSNVFLEIRAGTGGDEAAIFAGDLFRMYSRYAEKKRWQIEVMNTNDGEHGGYKEIIVRIIGAGAYSNLKFESGAHRVQRVPETDMLTILKTEPDNAHALNALGFTLADRTDRIQEFIGQIGRQCLHHLHRVFFTIQHSLGFFQALLL